MSDGIGTGQFDCTIHKKLSLDDTVFQTSINIGDQGFDFSARSYLAMIGLIKEKDYYFGNSMLSAGYDKNNKNLIIAEERICKVVPKWPTGSSVSASWENVKTSRDIDYLDFSIPSNTSNVIVKNMILANTSTCSGNLGVVCAVCGEIYDETDKCSKGFIFTFSLTSGMKIDFFDSATSPWYLYTNTNTNTNTTPAQRLDCGINMLYNITLNNHWTFIFVGYEDVIESGLPGIKRKGVIGSLGVGAFGDLDNVPNPPLKTIYPGDDSTGTNDNNDTDVVYIGSVNITLPNISYGMQTEVMIIMNIAVKSTITSNPPTLATPLTLKSQSSRSIQARRLTVKFSPSTYVDVDVEIPTLPILKITPDTVSGTTNLFKSIQYTCSTSPTQNIVVNDSASVSFECSGETASLSPKNDNRIIFATIYETNDNNDLLEIYGGIFSIELKSSNSNNEEVSGLGVNFPTTTNNSEECSRIYPLKNIGWNIDYYPIDKSINLIPRSIAFITEADSLKYSSKSLAGLFLSFDIYVKVDEDNSPTPQGFYTTNITTIVYGESLNISHPLVPDTNLIIHPFNEMIVNQARNTDVTQGQYGSIWNCAFMTSFAPTSIGPNMVYEYIQTSITSRALDITQVRQALAEYRYNIQIMCDTVYLFGFGSSINSPPVASHTVVPLLKAISNICLSKGTQILCDQGIINIEKINTRKHTINNKQINHITQSIHTDDYLIKIKKNCLSSNSPSSDIICSGDHKILYENKLIEAKKLINLICGVEKIKNDKRVLYNILMDKHEVIMANNTPVESLHPQNVVALFYNNYNNPQAREFLSDKIGQINNHNIRVNKINKNKLNGLMVGNKISKKMSLKM